jgi:hypothetical protein
MKSIEIDFDVEKALFLRRTSEEVSYNDVLRDVLGLGPKKTSVTTANATSGQSDWVSKGVRFPSGTVFRATYKGKTYYGKVEAGALVVENKRYYSPSSAAVDITGNMVNGWIFWECQFPGRPSWQMIKSLRKK